MFAKLAVTVVSLCVTGIGFHFTERGIQINPSNYIPAVSSVTPPVIHPSASQIDSTPSIPGATVNITTETQPIPFAVTTVVDTSLAPGKSVVRTPGVNGVRSITYRVTYREGHEISREIISSIVTTQPIDEVLAANYGHYMCPLTGTNTVGLPRGCNPGPIKM